METETNPIGARPPSLSTLSKSKPSSFGGTRQSLFSSENGIDKVLYSDSSIYASSGNNNDSRNNSTVNTLNMGNQMNHADGDNEDGNRFGILQHYFLNVFRFLPFRKRLQENNNDLPYRVSSVAATANQNQQQHIHHHNHAQANPNSNFHRSHTTRNISENMKYHLDDEIGPNYSLVYLIRTGIILVFSIVLVLIIWFLISNAIVMSEKNTKMINDALRGSMTNNLKMIINNEIESISLYAQQVRDMAIATFARQYELTGILDYDFIAKVELIGILASHPTMLSIFIGNLDISTGVTVVGRGDSNSLLVPSLTHVLPNELIFATMFANASANLLEFEASFPGATADIFNEPEFHGIANYTLFMDVLKALSGLFTVNEYTAGNITWFLGAKSKPELTLLAILPVLYETPSLMNFTVALEFSTALITEQLKNSTSYLNSKSFIIDSQSGLLLFVTSGVAGTTQMAENGLASFNLHYCYNTSAEGIDKDIAAFCSYLLKSSKSPFNQALTMKKHLESGEFFINSFVVESAGFSLTAIMMIPHDSIFKTISKITRKMVNYVLLICFFAFILCVMFAFSITVPVKKSLESDYNTSRRLKKLQNFSKQVNTAMGGPLQRIMQEIYILENTPEIVVVKSTLTKLLMKSNGGDSLFAPDLNEEIAEGRLKVDEETEQWLFSTVSTRSKLQKRNQRKNSLRLGNTKIGSLPIIDEHLVENNLNLNTPANLIQTANGLVSPYSIPSSKSSSRINTANSNNQTNVNSNHNNNKEADLRPLSPNNQTNQTNQNNDTSNVIIINNNSSSISVGNNRNNHDVPSANGIATLLTSFSTFNEQTTLKDMMSIIAPEYFQAETRAILEKIDFWDFNVFELESVSNGHALLILSVHILIEIMDVCTLYKIERHKLVSFLAMLEATYSKGNTYHCKTHAADVLQTCFVLSHLDAISERITEFELFSLLFSAIIHDYRHPGLTNQFLIKTKSSIAIRYNDKSVLENFHVAEVFEIISTHDEYSILSNFSDEDYLNFRSLVVTLVLSTDMSQHFDILNRFSANAIISSKTEEEKKLSAQILLQMLIKASDVSNPAKNADVASTWTKNVLEEWYKQGEMEVKAKLPISPYMNRNQPQMSKSQIGFIEFIVLPTMKKIEDVTQFSIPVHLAELNLKYWKSEFANFQLQQQLQQQQQKHIDSPSSLNSLPPMATGTTPTTPTTT